MNKWVKGSLLVLGGVVGGVLLVVNVDAAGKMAARLKFTK